MQSGPHLVDPADLVTAREAADLLGLTPQRIGQLIRAGALTALVRRERVTLLHRDDVEQYAAQRAGGRVAVA